jgi:glycosyltransferase involved in cell wall biosynthesis
MPRVTIITPNYNHARYLPQRLESILSQTYRDFELIVLDNASTDGSRAVIESYLHDPRARAVFNERNNGSPYKQWDLGLRLAKGEYVWIAESDDYAEPTLLGTLVDRLDRHPNVGLAMCQSWIVDQDGRIIHNYIDHLRLQDQLHGVKYDTSRWEADFIIPGRDYCINHLSFRPTIPNASAVVFRRGVLEAAGGAPVRMSYLGDYLTYVNVLSVSDIAFVADSLNYFRTHPETTRRRLALSDDYVREYRMVQRLLTERFGEPEWDRNFRDLLPRYVFYIIDSARRPPHNKVPARDAPALLARFARLDPAAFAIALRMLGRGAMADLVRRLGWLGLARRVKDTDGAGRERVPDDPRRGGPPGPFERLSEIVTTDPGCQRAEGGSIAGEDPIQARPLA